MTVRDISCLESPEITAQHVFLTLPYDIVFSKLRPKRTLVPCFLFFPLTTTGPR